MKKLKNIINASKIKSLKEWAKNKKKRVAFTVGGVALGGVVTIAGYSIYKASQNKDNNDYTPAYANESVEPTNVPTQEPTPSVEPTNVPTQEPTPSLEPTNVPTQEPTPSLEPTPVVTETITLEELKELVNAEKVSTDEYVHVYYELFKRYCQEDNQILSMDSVSSIVYYMNAGSLTEETLSEIAGSLVKNEVEAVIDDTAIACEDVINYNINSYMPTILKRQGIDLGEVKEVEPIKLSDAIVKEDQKKTVQGIEKLVETIAIGETKEERMEALKQFHSIIIYGDADVTNEPTTEKYDMLGFNELTPEQQFLIKQIYVVEVNVYAGTEGLDFTTYYDDKKSSAIGDFNRMLDPEIGTNPNPLKKDGCVELVKKR